MPRPVIALLTDFGLRDHYAGTMKGVALGICPDAALVDITHDVPPHDVMGGALALAASYRYFPPATVFLVVIDPGVGTKRRGIAAECGGYRFVAPDNGVLSMALDDMATEHSADAARLQIVELTERRFERATISQTFEARDRFAPAAASLASGTPLAALGRPADSLHRLQLPRPVMSEGQIDGEVLCVDRFGNLTTNIERRQWAIVGDGPGLSIHVGDRVLRKVVGTYGEAAAGEICALFGSWDRLEIAVNGGSARDELQAARGTPVQVRWS